MEHKCDSNDWKYKSLYYWVVSECIYVSACVMCSPPPPPGSSLKFALHCRHHGCIDVDVAGRWRRAGPWRQSAGSGGRTVVSEQPRRKCREVKSDAKEKHHCWSWWKEQKGARLDLDSGEWDKDQFRAEVENHDYIQCVKDDRRKMKNT